MVSITFDMKDPNRSEKFNHINAKGLIKEGRVISKRTKNVAAIVRLSFASVFVLQKIVAASRHINNSASPESDTCDFVISL